MTLSVRDISFRAITLHGYKSVEGSLIQGLGFHRILTTLGEVYEVKPDSVRESTGLFDCHGFEIFNGDVLDTKNSTMDIKVKVVWDQDNACYDVNYLAGGRYGRLNKKNASNWYIVRKD